MNTTTTCNTSSLSEYVPSANNPWNLQKVNHLFRRAAYGITPEKGYEILLGTPQEAVDAMIEESVNLPASVSRPNWLYSDDLPFNNTALRRFVGDWFTDDLISNRLKYRLALFWSNHFVTEEVTVADPRFVAQYYYDLLDVHALGNFRTFVHEVGISSAMLVYLNGNVNNKSAPNENYARELYELFTLGVDNGYTQDDIEETARALTGWTTREEGRHLYSLNLDDFDDGEKTIFGETGNWGYDDVVRILFEKHGERIAKFICAKFYAYFVSPDVNEAIVEELAQTFMENDFEIVPVLSQLFKSEHFFDPGTEGVIIKSPYDVELCLTNELSALFRNSYTKVFVRPHTLNAGQAILMPPNVAGWQGNLSWITSNFMILRWEGLRESLDASYGFRTAPYRTFVQQLMRDNNVDVEVTSRTIMNYFVSRPILEERDYIEGLAIFKGDVPSNYFEDGTWNLNFESVPEQVFALMQFIVSIPEFQLK